MKPIATWQPEDESFWQSTGKRIATRNLLISVPNLLCGFAVWIFWSIIVVAIQRVNASDPSLFAFGFEGPQSDAYRAMLYMLPAVAGLSGATMRVPTSFMIAITGGRNAVTMTTLLLMLPAAGVGIALQNPETPFFVLVLLALLSGFGGGAFAASMSNISFFFPKRMQGLALGINAGIGNLGVSVMQLVIPWVITFGLFGGVSYEVTQVANDVETTTSMWPQNAGLVWLPILGVLAILAWVGMNNLPIHDVGRAPVAWLRGLWLWAIGLIAAAIGGALLLLDWGGVPQLLKFAVVIVVAIVVTLTLMRYATPKVTRGKIREQFTIFSNKHNWIMTILYIMTFGSFIGFSSAFPKLIEDVFGYIRVDEAGEALAVAASNPNAPNPFAFAWLGPLVGSLIRPVGGWLSDKFGGAAVTQWSTVLLILATIGVAWTVIAASLSPTPEDLFVPFLLLFLLLFVMTGIGNGSTFRMIPIIFPPQFAGPVLGWTSAVAAYGAFVMPMIFGMQIEAGQPEYAFYGFAIFYGVCLVLNWYYYARKKAEVPC